MKTVCNLNKCVGCRACEELCPKSAIEIVDDTDVLNAIIDENICVQCNICQNVCQINNPIEKSLPIEWFQGWSLNDDVRKNSSSGGLAAELSRTIILEDGVVCSCKFIDGEFRFVFAKNLEDLKGFSGSKYVKSNPQNVYKRIIKILNSGRSVLFIGLPCQCAAVKRATSEVENNKLYIVDLICHGTPSPKLLDAFFSQYDSNLKKIKDISFREKGQFSIKQDSKNIVTPGSMDCYSIAFLNGLIYTENCYECYYADSLRISDITIGDSWGSDLQDSNKGISLILCNSEKGRELVEKSNVYLTNVSIENAIESNPQLKRPTLLSKKRKLFFEGYKKGKKFNWLVMNCCTYKWFRQFVKRQLIRMRICFRGEK